MSTEQLNIHWSEMIIIFNSLIKNIEEIRERIDTDTLDDDELLDAEEELNDYVMLVPRLRERYAETSDTGELSEGLSKKLREIC